MFSARASLMPNASLSALLCICIQFRAYMLRARAYSMPRRLQRHVHTRQCIYACTRSHAYANVAML